jgi:hypothetical protein
MRYHVAHQLPSIKLVLAPSSTTAIDELDGNPEQASRNVSTRS